MPQPKPWLEEIIEVLEELGGHGTLADINQMIQDREIMNLTLIKEWKVRVRTTIYYHSSDCDIYTSEVGGIKDIFYAVGGKGNGHWGLRSFQPNDNRVDLTEDDLGFIEGKKKLRQHIYRERNPRVILLAKQRFKEQHNGRLFCEICGFDFQEKYGEIGDDFIEGHHTIPVSKLEEGHKTKIDDIALVCSNCHKMLHRRRPWLNKTQLRELLDSRLKN